MVDESFRRFVGDGSRSSGGRTSIIRGDAGRYIASRSIATAVNTALAAERPLLLTGEPGCGKSSLAYAVADELGLGDVLQFNVRSDSSARDVLYTFDHLRRLYEAQAKDPRATDPANYVALQALGTAIASDRPRVVLIDEIDKASRDFPNDLLGVIDEMDFDVIETHQHFRHSAAARPIVFITSNIERQLPEPFLRRCVYHHIAFPDDATLERIVRERIGDRDNLGALAVRAVERFANLRRQYGDSLAKQPATAELLSWVRVLWRAGLTPEEVAAMPIGELFPGALLKTKQDFDRVLGG
jgi:MoxR-like ATPase